MYSFVHYRLAKAAVFTMGGTFRLLEHFWWKHGLIVKSSEKYLHAQSWLTDLILPWIAVNVHMPKDRITQAHQGYGFIEFMSEEDADYAIKIMNMIKLFGKPIRVNKVGGAMTPATMILRFYLQANGFIRFFITIIMWSVVCSVRFSSVCCNLSNSGGISLVIRVARYYRYTGVPQYLGVPVRYRGIYEYKYSTAVCGHHTVFF